MYGLLDISTSGMIAQRTRLAVSAANLANRNTVFDAQGNFSPYRARRVVFAPGDPSAQNPAARTMGVHVAQISLDQSDFNYRYDPGNPNAIQTGPRQGYVPEPNVNPVVEQMNAMEAGRAYEANVAAAEATKAMVAQALRLLA
ncbi:MAG: flagellar basal body rod protein FlgC [Planctomycetota bacterium]|nr:flagellar basal body rod protein FlgC [Planctomycetota bacterium]